MFGLISFFIAAVILETFFGIAAAGFDRMWRICLLVLLFVDYYCRDWVLENLVWPVSVVLNNCRELQLVRAWIRPEWRWWTRWKFTQSWRSRSTGRTTVTTRLILRWPRLLHQAAPTCHQQKPPQRVLLVPRWQHPRLLLLRIGTSWYLLRSVSQFYARFLAVCVKDCCYVLLVQCNSTTGRLKINSPSQWSNARFHLLEVKCHLGLTRSWVKWRSLSSRVIIYEFWRMMTLCCDCLYTEL